MIFALFVCVCVFGGPFLVGKECAEGCADARGQFLPPDGRADGVGVETIWGVCVCVCVFDYCLDGQRRRRRRQHLASHTHAQYHNYVERSHSVSFDVGGLRAEARHRQGCFWLFFVMSVFLHITIYNIRLCPFRLIVF